MQVTQELDKYQIRELLSKGWLTHDAMWFYTVSNELGMEKTNQFNLAAIESMAAIEIKRYLKALGYPKDKVFTAFKDFTQFFNDAFSILKADFMDFDYAFPEHNILSWKWNSCFAYSGISMLGTIDHYQCGVIHRMVSWFNTLGLSYTIEPEIRGCLMHSTGSCEGVFRFGFEK
ncbi:MAG: DUF6125 family protein [Thermodesulfobacteriota bacterium]|nr:DUF6125 family protein [Thermodesulfobacteriota bacterium]